MADNTKRGKSVWIGLTPELQAIALIDKAMQAAEYTCTKQRVIAYAIAKHFPKGFTLNNFVFIRHNEVKADFTT